MAFFSCLSCFKKVEEVDVTELDFSHCSLNDVPNDVFVYERTLEDLSLESNNIRDLPRQLFHCHGLKQLRISDNDVHVLPSALSSLSQLVVLDISKNVLTDIPDTIKQCKQLTVLDASINPLQKIPEGCTQLLSITELYLNDTFLEFLPANFGRLAKLKILELRENGLNNLPKSLSRLTCLERLDIGQNEISEIPEVIGSLTNLKELWVDCNRVKQVPPIIGNLKNLVHLNLDINRIDYISDNISNCSLLTDLSLCTNELKELPEMGFAGLESLVTLKLDDNQIEELPMSIGKLKNLEELFLSQNYLEHLPPSIGLCRKLHTLNVDDNDIEYLPKELGSCISLKILSAHGNRLITLPAELDHISNLAVINLTANNVRYLPVSLTKLTKISAIWLSENQHKPLVQLNQDTDPETGQRVLTNFLLPQSLQNQHDYKDNISESGSFHASVWEEERLKKSLVKWREGGADIGDKEGVRFDANYPNDDMGSGKGLRREPTPFPKEMRAMAKRAQNLRSKGVQGGSTNSSVEEQATDAIQRKKNKEHRPRMVRKETEEDVRDGNNVPQARVAQDGQNIPQQQQSPNGHMMGNNIQIKEAKVTKANASPVLSERHILSVYQDEKTAKEELELSQFEELERAILSNNFNKRNSSDINNMNAGNNRYLSTRMSPDKNSKDSGVITPSDAGTNSGSRTSPEQDPPSISGMSRNPSDPLPQAPVTNHSNRNNPGEMVMPVKAEIVTTELNDPHQTNQEKVPPPYHIAASMSKHASDFKSIHLPSHDNRAAGYNNGHEYENQQELERKSSFSSEFDGASSISESEASTAPSSLQTIVRSPYKDPQANGVHNGNGLHPQAVNSNGHHQVINQAGINSLSSECSDLSPPTTPVPNPQPPLSSVGSYSSNVSSTSSMIPTRRTSQPPTGGVAPLSNQNLNSRMGGGNNENREEHSDLDSVQNHAQNLRKVSEQLLSNPRTRQSFTGASPAIPGSGLPVVTSRPGSVASPKSSVIGQGSAVPSPVSKIPLSSTSSSASSRPSSQMSGKVIPSGIPSAGSNLSSRKTSSPGQNGSNLQHQAAGSEVRPGSFAAPPNTVGLPSVPSPLPSSSSTSSSKSQNSKILNTSSGIPRLNNTSNGIKSPSQQRSQHMPPPPLKLRHDNNSNITPNNGLLSTIEQAAHSDEEPSSPPALPPSHHGGTKFPATTRVGMTSPNALRGSGQSRVPLPSRAITASPQPNYENISTPVSRTGGVGQGYTTGIPKLGSPLNNGKLEQTTNLKGSLQTSQGDRISTAQFVATSKRESTLNSSISAKKSSIPTSSLQTRSPSPMLSSSAIPSARVASPLASNQRSSSTTSPTGYSNNGMTAPKTSLPMSTKNNSISNSRIPLPK